MKPYFDRHGFPVPQQTNVAEFILDLVNTDFQSEDSNRLALLGENPETAKERLFRIHQDWTHSDEAKSLLHDIGHVNNKEMVNKEQGPQVEALKEVKPGFASMLLTLLHRSFIKSYRDIVAYWVRVVMYSGLAILMGTVWLRLDANQQSIQPFINSIFFGAACESFSTGTLRSYLRAKLADTLIDFLSVLSFMAVAYVPAYLEDTAVFSKDRANGLYGPALFMTQNFVIGAPYLCKSLNLYSSISKHIQLSSRSIACLRADETCRTNPS